MPAYVISNVEATDQTRAAEYRALAQETVERYGGKFVVRGGAMEVLEGEWSTSKRVVIIQFDSVEHARRWYESPEYARARAIAKEALIRTLLVVDGIPAP